MAILCFGELLIDFVAQEQGVAVGEAAGFVKAAGGAPANVAVAIARLDSASSFMGQVGEDPFGRYLAGVLEREGVDIRSLRFSRGARTALAFVSNRRDGERSFMFYRHPSADMLMQPADVDLAAIARCETFHHGSITFIHEPAASALRLALETAVAAGKFIAYDPNLRLPLWGSAEAAKAGILAGLETANLLKLSEEELHFLVPGGELAQLWREHMEFICVTYGARGAALHLRDGRVFEHGGFAVRAVDSTGAGDAFLAAMLVALTGWRDGIAVQLPEILAFANAVGALTCLQKGAIPALPTLAEARAFLAERA